MKFTHSALHKIKSLLQADQYFRVRLQAGGCKGLEYSFEITARPDDYDSLYEEGGARILMDKKTEVLLANATLDFETNLMGSRFSIDFADGRSKCSCGTSFTL